MKNLKQLLGIILSCFVVFTSFGQEVDDMYFNSKDRAKLNEGKITADLGLNKLNKKNTGISEASSPINPTDSYSARNINPEYAAQIKDGSQPVIEDDYFIQDFQPTGINQNISNCNCSSGTYYNPNNAGSSFNNPFYGMGGYGMGGSYYPSYGYGGYPAYGGFNSGLSMSMGYGFGSYNPGFYGGMGYGYGNYGSIFGNPYSPWGGNYYGSSYYPRQTIIIYNGDPTGTRVTYTKRASRSSDLNYSNDNSRPNSSYQGSPKFDGRATVNNGRSSSVTPEYYDRGWKQNRDTNATRGYWNNTDTGTNSNHRSGFNHDNMNMGGRQGSGFSTPSRGSFDSGSNFGGSRSGSSGSGSSGGSTRSRSNN